MKFNRIIILYLGVLLCLAGCGSGKNSKADFKLDIADVIRSGITANASIAQATAGGFVLVGVELSGENRSFSRVSLSGVDAPSMVLSNGQWRFFAMAWEAPAVAGDYFTGTVRCAASNSNLNGGGAVTVSLNLTNAACDTVDFRGSHPMWYSAGELRFPKQQLITCHELGSSPPSTGDCEYDITSPLTERTKGYATGFKFSIQSHDTTGGGYPQFIAPGTEISSSCLTVVSGGASISGGLPSPVQLNLPTAPSFNIGMKLKTYFFNDSAFGCDATENPKITWLPNGVSSNVSGTLLFENTNVSTINTVKLYSKTTSNDVCASSGTVIFGNSNEVAEVKPPGFGSNNHPYNICSISHLKYFQGLPVAEIGRLGSSIRLVKNLNYWMNLPNKSSASSINEFANSSNEFDLIKSAPIGISPTIQATTTTPLSGNFDGNNKKVIGFETEFDQNINVDKIGFIRYSSGMIKDLELIAAFVDVNSSDTYKSNDIGILAGKAANDIQNIKISKSEVEGQVNVGGVVGTWATNTSNKELVAQVSESKVRGAVYVGGLAGLILSNSTGTTITKSKFTKSSIEGNKSLNIASPSSTAELACLSSGINVWIQNMLTMGNCHPMNGTATAKASGYYLGGLVGGTIIPTAANFLTINESFSSGEVIGARGLGGILGLSQNSTIANSYSTMNVISTDSNFNRVGGIVGVSVTNTDLNQVFHLKGFVGLNSHASTLSYSNVGSILQHGAGLIGFSVQSALDSCNDSFSQIATVDNSAMVVGCNVEQQDYALARPAIGTSYFTNFSTNIWRNNFAGFDIPQLQWEEARPCHNITNAFTSPGTINGIYPICHPNQFLSSSANFKVLDDIDMRGISGTISNFSGVIDGNGHFISNYIIPTTNSSWFINQSGILKNLKLRGFQSESNINSNNLGLLADISSGSLINISLYGVINLPVSNPQNMGGLVGINTGTIRNVESYASLIPGNALTSSSFLGGIAGINSGLIERSRVSSPLVLNITSNTLSTVGSIGGVTGKNDVGGQIKEVEFNGQFNLGTSSVTGAYPSIKIGGISGINLGTILDSIARFGMSQFVYNGSTIDIDFLFAGISPDNTGVIERTIVEINGGDLDTSPLGGTVANSNNYYGISSGTNTQSYFIVDAALDAPRLNFWNTSTNTQIKSAINAAGDPFVSAWTSNYIEIEGDDTIEPSTPWLFEGSAGKLPYLHRAGTTFDRAENFIPLLLDYAGEASP
jgi:hypothetical protein